MPRRPIDLEPYKAEIIRIFQNDSIESVIQYLQHHHQLQAKRTTIKNWLRRWEIRKLNPKVTTDAELHARIKVLFYQVGLEETDMITVLHQDGYAINRRTLRRIRKGLGLVRRAANPALVQQQAECALKSLNEEFNKGIIEGYGKQMLHKHFRSELGIIISRLVSTL
jgi:hypothetical protein